MTETQSPADFMRSAPTPVGGSSPWASRYSAEIKRVVHEHAARAPRSLQQHLGPSEIGSPCDRQVAGKMAALPSTNHVSDPWPSIMGTAGHAWLADAFVGDNERSGLMRWLAETPVTPHPDHPGTADLYDGLEQAVVDHKLLGATSLNKIRNGWPRVYLVQLLFYGLGFYRLGLPVRRVVVVAYPRTAASLSGLYVRETRFADEHGVIYPEVLELIETVYAQTARRRQHADEIVAGRQQLLDVPAAPDGDTCYFCDFYRPQSARDGGPGCPGTSGGAS